MANTTGEKELKTDWPVVEGNTLGSTKIKGKKINLVPEGILGIASVVSAKEKVGLN